MKKSVLVSLLLIGGIVLFSGCASKLPYSTKVGVSKGTSYEATASIKVDQTSTYLGWMNTDSVVRTNYLYSLATAAQITKDKGYKYFSISDSNLQQQFKDKEVQNIEDAYDACAGLGVGTFKLGMTDLPILNFRTLADKNACDHITLPRKYLGTMNQTDYRVIINYLIRMDNRVPTEENKYYTFIAEDVLKDDLFSGLDKEYYKNNSHE